MLSQRGRRAKRDQLLLKPRKGAPHRCGPYRRVELTYELFQRWFPEVPEQARAIKRSEARRGLVQRYLDNVVAADRNRIAKVFNGLKCTTRELERTIATLLEGGTIQEVQVEGLKQPQLVT